MHLIRLLMTGALTLGLCAAAPAHASGRTARPTVDAPVKAAMSGGNTVQTEVREARPRADGYRHIDTPTLIRRLKAIGANSYVYGIWNSPTDWSDLVNEFAPAAQKAGIRVLVYTVPPTECSAFDENGNLLPRNLRGRCSMPYGKDYVAWARAVADLSLKYPTIFGWAIDDFQFNQDTFTPQYMTEIRAAQDAINPKLKLYSLVYLDTFNDDTYLNKYGKFVDGLIYAYLGKGITSTDPDYVEQNIEAILRKTQPRGIDLMVLFYVGRSPDVLEPDESYVADVLRRVQPYLNDGRVKGVLAYGTPLVARPEMSADYLAHTGNGWLHLFAQGGLTASTDNQITASQTVAVDPHAARHELSFWHYDELGHTATPGVYEKQLLVNGKVVWSSDIDDEPAGGWQHVTVDLSGLTGSTATVTFRLLLPAGHTSYSTALSVGFDSVTGTGIAVHNGDFERATDWALSSTDPAYLHHRIEIYAFDRPERVANAMARAWGGPGVHYPHYPKPALGLANRAMFGNGRLSLSVPAHTTTTQGACASATQVVRVMPSPRYELSFWWYVRRDISPAQDWLGHHFVDITIDGKSVWRYDAASHYYWWQNGVGWQGPVDVTDFVTGKRQITLSFRLCEDKPVTDFATDVGFDTIQTIGLQVHNPGFESRGGWTLRSTAPAPRAKIVIAS